MMIVIVDGDKMWLWGNNSSKQLYSGNSCINLTGNVTYGFIRKGSQWVEQSSDAISHAIISISKSRILYCGPHKG